VDTDSPATGEILYRFFKDIEAENSGGNQGSIITTDMALALYTAILTDTGSFRYDRTDSRTHDIISDLLDYGIKPFDVYSEVYNRASIGKLHLLGRFLNNITLVYDGTVAYSTLLQKDFEETFTDEYAIEGFSTHLMSLETVKMCIVITETKRGVKLSFRSKGEVSSNELAKEFGGGGHQNASGAFVPGGKIGELTPMVIDRADRFVRDS
jgi:phosphoesterase RecJ-like protein